MTKKQEISEVKKQSEDLFKLVLKKTNTSYNEFIDMMKEMYVAANISVVTPDERGKFTKLSFG